MLESNFSYYSRDYSSIRSTSLSLLAGRTVVVMEGSYILVSVQSEFRAEFIATICCKKNSEIQSNHLK